METTAIHISKEAYNCGESYAKSHNTSVNKMVENYLLTLMMMVPPTNSHEKKGKISWREMDIPEEVRKMSLPKRPGFPDDDKNMMETLLREKY